MEKCFRTCRFNEHNYDCGGYKCQIIERKVTNKSAIIFDRQVSTSLAIKST